uniref:Interleukin 1 receptor type 1 n=1 Tax=Chelydra serpentina TaxID=8475 RepID=A0A8C3T2D6_CHESE
MALKWTISNDILLIPSHKIVRFQIAGELFLYSCLFKIFSPSCFLEECMVHDVLHSQRLVSVLVGEPLTIDCLLDKTLALQHMNYSLTWYKSGRKIPVTQVKLSRIHQHENLLWFMPAILEDSGSYECVLWNLTSCNKIYFNVIVFKNTVGLCFNGDFLYAQEIPASSNENIVCPHLDYFRDEKNTLPIHWYKECNLIDNERFLSRNDDLRIISANVNDSGNYSCKMTYNYMGKEYNISRNIYVTVIGKSRFYSSYITYFSFADVVRNFQGYLIGGLLAPVFVIVVAMLIYKYFKVDIVLWYRKSCRPFLSKEVSDGKIYDAYVLYPKINKVDCIYTSDNFVLTLLPEVLERQCGYNLFILGRDDLPGKAVVNVVDETIKQSRRLIIVLVPESSSLLEDIFEQQLAVYNALVQDGIKVILIELDKIKDYTNMPESIKYIKQKHGAIKWKGDFTEKSYSANTKFWKNVRYRMPPRCPTSSELHLLPTHQTQQKPLGEK